MTTTAKIVSHAEWKRARKDFLAKEKEFTRLRDELSRARRALRCLKGDRCQKADRSGTGMAASA